jgi:predicted  nucleic acid-binding Zn-ribbon protein
MIERQELHCHNCNQYVQFNLDLEINGQHILTCPKCGHKHYRYIKDGKISDRRWGQDPSQDNSYQVTGPVTYSIISTFTTASTTSTFLYSSWMNSSSTSCA